jgi:hypothetical protein
MNSNKKFNKQLLVEGNDDQHVIWALCVRFELKQNFEVIDCKGIDRLYEQIPVRFKQSDIDTIGIIVDADTDLQGRWSSLRGLLTSQGFAMPDELPNTGLVVTNSDNKKIGVWIMPNNDLNGMLEDFISFLVPKGDKLLPVVHKTLQEIEDKEINKYAIMHKSKAVIHSWLSWQEDPGTPMGLGITKRYLTTDEGSCLLLINWLRALF